jgi:endonuclease YncB( thermonuclease family)
MACPALPSSGFNCTMAFDNPVLHRLCTVRSCQSLHMCMHPILWMFMLSVAIALGSSDAVAEQLHEPWSVTCSDTRRFHDGDTLTCVSDSIDHGTFVIRFAGIDAPETGQAFWRESRDLLRALAVPGTRASCYKQDRYGREVCRLQSVQGRDLAEVMLKNGLVWHATKYGREQTQSEHAQYAASEIEAQNSRLGIWSDVLPQPPWECRELRRNHQRCR